MPRGDKSSYTDKQRRKARHIEESYRKRGTPAERAKRIAYSTVNKESGGGNKSGSGRGKKDSNESSTQGGRKGGNAVSHRKRVEAGKQGARTRKRNAS